MQPSADALIAELHERTAGIERLSDAADVEHTAATAPDTAATAPEAPAPAVTIAQAPPTPMQIFEARAVMMPTMQSLQIAPALPSQLAHGLRSQDETNEKL